MNSLLLLVDVQNDYLATPALEPHPGAVAERAGALLRCCREAGVPVAHVWTTVSRDDDRRMPHWKRDGRWICEEGTDGHAPPPGLEPRAGETVVHKTGFGAFRGGELDRLIDHHRVERLVVAGIHLHACVRQAVLDAYERGLHEIWVVEDATASDDPVHAAITRRYLERRAARFLPVSDVVGALRGVDAGSGGDVAASRAVDSAVAAARSRLPEWQALGGDERVRVLEQLADALETEAERLADLMADEIGKPVRFGSVEVRRSAQMLRAVGGHAAASDVEAGAHGTEIHRRPLGLVSVVTPWNSPVYIPLGKIAPALAYGNAVVWKPAPAAQPMAERLSRLLATAGLPDGVLGLVAGGPREAQAAMSHPAVDAVTVTGGSLAGFAAQEICARRRVPLQAELGGNNGALVWEDADLVEAAEQIAAGAFGLSGQRCTANRRVVVPETRHDEFVELLTAATAKLAWGDPRDPQTVVGPIVSATERDRVAAVVARAKAAGARLIRPHGREPEGRSAWYPPTLVLCDDPGHEIVREETFGPVVVVQPAGSWDEALELVNCVRQGLVAAVFTASPELAERFASDVQAGIVKVNASTADAEVDVPFVGWKWSGIGPPEHGSFDRDFYTRPQVVYRSAVAVA